MTKITVDKAMIEQVIEAAFSPYCAQALGILVPALRAALAKPVVEPDSSIKVWVLVDKDGSLQKWRAPCFVGPESDTQLECFDRAQPDRSPHKSVMLAAPQPPAEVPLLTHGEVWAIWNGEIGVDEMNQQEAFKFAGLIEQAVRHSAGLK